MGDFERFTITRAGGRAQSCYLVSRMYSFGTVGGGHACIHRPYPAAADRPIRYHDVGRCTYDVRRGRGRRVNPEEDEVREVT